LLDSSPTSTAHQSEEYEPLDSKLHSRAAELYRKEEDLLEEIAALKREAPLQAAANWREALKGGIERDEEALRDASRGVDGQDVKLDVGKRERQEEVERTWGKGVEGLGRLKREMPGTTARMERAKRAADYVLAEGKGAKV
jgi:kinetochor protein Mis14/NSL1